ncbi:MAG: hypothetical protein ACRDJN_04035, partial [Chloroflexota bacterium]
IPPSGLFRRRRYEIEFPPDAKFGSTKREVTATPVTVIDRYLGVGDAWTLVHAADAAWNGHSGEWVTLVEVDDSA